MEKLCQPSLNGRGGPIAPIAIQETNFGLKNDMIQQVQNSCQFHGLPGDDANKHLDKFLHVTQSIKMAKMFLEKYFPPSMVTKLRNEITNFRQRLDESLFKAWERYKLSIDRCPNHNMLPVTQIDTFYNGLTLRQRDTINAATGGTFMKRPLKAEMAEINKNLMRVLQPPLAILKTFMLREPIKAILNNRKATVIFLAIIPQPQVFTTNEFTNFMKANDAILKNMQTNMTSLTNSNLELKNMFGLFMKMNIASSLGSGTLPGNTITNPKEGRKGITTRRGNAYPGRTIPTSSSPVVEHETEATKDTMHPTNNGSTEDVQPLVVPTESPILTSEPVISLIIELVASPVSTPRPNQRPLIPYPSRLQDQKLRDKANDQREKFFQIFKDLNFNISFADALILMPKFSPSIKILLTNKDKLSLTDLGTSINLMPLSVWNKLSLLDLSPTCMTLELTDRLISCPVGVAEDVFIKVGTLYFSADFVVVDFDADPRVPLILERSFLKTGRALIDVFEGELTLRVGKAAINFNLDQTSRYSANYNDMTAKRIHVIDMACEEYSQEVLGFFDVITSGNPTPYYDPIVSTTSLTLTPFGNSDFLLEEVDAFLALEDDPTSPEDDQSYVDTEGDILLLEAFLNDDPSLPPQNQGNYLPEVRKELKICEAKSDKSSSDEPLEVKLKDLPPHLEYAFLEGDDKLPVIIVKDLSIEEKTALITVLKSHKRAIAWKLSDITGFLIAACLLGYAMHQACFRGMMAIFHDMMEKTMEVFMDDFLVFRNSFQRCLSHLEKMLKRCGDTNLCLNWEKSHFMVKEGIVLGHKISKEGIKVDKAKVDVITKLPHPTTVKGIRSFLGHFGFYRSDFTIGAVLGQRQEKHFRIIHYASKTMTEAEFNYTTTEKEMLDVVQAFEKFRSYLIINKSIVYTDHFALKYLFAKKDSKARLLRWVLFLQEFTFKVIDTKGAENLAADHLSRLQNYLYTLSLGDMMVSSPICLLSKASKTKSWLWHRRLSHLNFGAINHLARQGLVRGIPKLKFEKDYLCSTCAMGKSKKKSHKSKSEDPNQEKLYLLHMDLCGLMHVKSVNGKKYILVIFDDYSRFTWVKCLRSKDEAPDFIIKFLKMIQVRIKVPVCPKRVVERRNRMLIEAARTMLIYAQAPLFLWAEAVATACYTQNRSIVRLRHGKTPYELLHDKLPDLSSGLVPKPTSSTPFVPPSRNEWDLSFQPLFDKLLAPTPSVDPPAFEVIVPLAKVIPLEHAESTGSPSSTTVDQDAQSPNKSQTTPETQPPFIPHDVEEDNHDIEVAHMGNDPLFGMPIPEVASDQSLSTDSIHTVVHPDHQISQHNSKWTKDHPLENIIGQLARLIEAMQKELNEFERLEVWELVPRPDKVMVITLKWIYKVKLDKLGGLQISQSPRGIFINQSKYALESLKKYGFKSYDPVDTPMVEKSKLDEDKERKAVDPSHYRGMIGTLLYPTASRPDLQLAICMCARLISWSSEMQKSAAISSTEAEYIALSGCCAQILWMRSQLTNYGLGFNKIPMYRDNKSAIALCFNNVQHSRLKHIDFRYHFIKEHVENGVIELYFVKTKYQLAYIFTKALGRQRIEFLINKMGMRSLTPETLKQLVDEVDE
nr:transposon Ty3-I Gag-Pol polyprotein [Tanacetum cinerariifolium]